MTRLHPADIEAVARRVVALLSDEGLVAPSGRDMIDAAEVARRFGVTPDWARRNARRLDGIRLGAGPKARWRFDPAKVEAALSALSGGVRSQVDSIRSTGGPQPPRHIVPTAETPGTIARSQYRLGGGTQSNGAAPRERPAPAPGGKS